MLTTIGWILRPAFKLHLDKKVIRNVGKCNILGPCVNTEKGLGRKAYGVRMRSRSFAPSHMIRVELLMGNRGIYKRF